MWQPHLSEVFLYSFQEFRAADRTREDEFIHHYLKNPLMTKNHTNNDKLLLNIRLNSKIAKQSALPLNSSHLRQYAFKNDAFFYNPSEDAVGVEGITTSDITLIYEHKEQTENAFQTLNEGEEKHRVIDYKALLTQNENIKDSETQIQTEIDELLESVENFRSGIILKLQKVTNKRSELIEELRVDGSNHEEQLTSLRHAVKEVKKRIRAKRQDIKKLQEDIPVHVEGIDRLQFLRYIWDMTLSSCGQKTQLTAVVRDTVEYNRRIEALERHLRLYFARREAEVYKAPTKSESGSVLKELQRSIVGVREGYRALVGAIGQRGELLVELHRMNDRVDTLRAEVNACNSVKVEDDVKELRKRNNAVYEHLQEQQQQKKNKVSVEVKM
ncbi:hypothetical protein LSM04_004453 [Trypanosoma melophagium]|uniref:uncharacterized protein n=1 Tax=Trypanosoma melophagium TaxID=715481 RepID=UPI00351A9681|nr:hypothetical protein LSM04_004453 [Trypanosoma melophagium]